MDFGFRIPTRGPFANPADLAAMARRGEELGFAILCVSDHVVIPNTIKSRYPYSEGGEFTGTGECLDQLTLLSFLAGVTSKARLLTSVMVLPHRPPVLTAKMLATVDVLSAGRLIVGCGVGWMKEEFEVLGAPPHAERGAVGNEYIRAFKELWTSDEPSFEGKYSRFDDVTFLPKPVQKPHPPIWIGGESPAALRRAARLGNGWYPIGNNPRYPLGTVAQLSDRVARLRRYAEEAGREPAEIDITYSIPRYDDRHAQTLADGGRATFTGTPEQVAGDIRSFEELGVRHMTMTFPGETLGEVVEAMERFVSEVKPMTEG